MTQLGLYLAFWCKCAKEAASGLFDKASALAGLLGTAILLLIGLHVFGKNWPGPTDAVGGVGFSLLMIVAATITALHFALHFASQIALHFALRRM